MSQRLDQRPPPVTLKMSFSQQHVLKNGPKDVSNHISVEESQEWGASEWAIPMIDVLFDGSADSVDYIASQLIDRENYFRFQTRLSDAYDDLDHADTTNLHALSRLAIQYLESADGREKFQQLVEKLLDSDR